MVDGDIAGAMAVAERVHPNFPEGPAMYRDRIALFPDGCLVAEVGGDIAGYALAYPARFPSPPPLDTVLGGLEAGADALYLHDIAILPEHRGSGLSTEAVSRLLALAEPFGLAMLVSVYGTGSFWARRGFAEEAIPPGKLASYGADAVFMVRRKKTSSISPADLESERAFR